jgi:two-component system, cell cycle response regulator
MQILIAEDDTVSRLIIEAKVAQLGHDFVSAANGEEAWRLFQENNIDVVISDRSMPGMNGLELCRRVRSWPDSNKYIYFIFVTSSGDKNRVLDANEAGADDYLVKPLDTDQLATRLVVAERITKLHEKLAWQQSQLELLNRQLFDQARMDPLTGLHNRLKLREDLELLTKQDMNDAGPLCALMFDVDNFKSYNDTYGHFAGDEILTRVADMLLKNLRPNDRKYRFGGEEFLVILERTPLQQSCQIAELCRNAIQTLQIPHAASAQTIVTMSAGVAQWAQTDETINAWLKNADAALYQAKSLGRNRVYPAAG